MVFIASCIFQTNFKMLSAVHVNNFKNTVYVNCVNHLEILSEILVMVFLASRIFQTGFQDVVISLTQALIVSS